MLPLPPARALESHPLFFCFFIFFLCRRVEVPLHSAFLGCVQRHFIHGRPERRRTQGDAAAPVRGLQESRVGSETQADGQRDISHEAAEQRPRSQTACTDDNFVDATHVSHLLALLHGHANVFSRK